MPIAIEKLFDGPIRNVAFRSIILAGLLMLSTGCGSGGNSEGQRFGGRGGEIPAVEVVQARLGTLPLEQRLSGIVEARNQVTIYPELSARIEQVLVDNGDVVQRGQTLVRLAPRQYQEQLRQAEADLRVQQASMQQAQARLRELEVELTRMEDLSDQEFISALEIERLRARVEGARADYNRAAAVVEAAEANLAERQEMVSRSVVRAPVAGVVGARNAEVGMSVDPSTQLFVVGDLTNVRVRVTLTERMLRHIEVGQTALIRSEYLGDRVIEAEVSRISPFLAAGSFTTEATIDVPNPEGAMHAGMYVDVDILYGETQEATLVPNSALHEDPGTGRMGVFIAPELRATLEEPELEVIGGGPILTEPTPVRYVDVEVLARGRATSGVRGIQPDEWVVAVGQGMLTRNARDEPQLARTRAIPWDRLLGLQELQQQDVLLEFMERQQRIAALGRDTTNPASRDQSN